MIGTTSEEKAVVDTYRVGYISASDPGELSYEFGSILPSFLKMECAAPRNPVRLVTVEALAAAESGLDEAAQDLVARGVQAIVVSIAPLVFLGGVGYDRIIIDRLQSLTGLPVTTNQTTAIDALKFLGVGRIALINPNSSNLLPYQMQFFGDSGIAIEVAKSMDIADNRDIDCVPSDVSYEFVKSAVVDQSRVEGIYLSGPCWRTLDIIDPLESEFNIPVVSALQAMVWGTMRLLDVWVPVSGYGRLMETPLNSGKTAVQPSHQVS